MTEQGWDWEVGRRPVCDMTQLRQQYAEVHETVVSADGERLAAPVVAGPDVFRVWTSDGQWDGEYEKAWNLVFAPDGELAGSTGCNRFTGEWQQTLFHLTVGDVVTELHKIKRLAAHNGFQLVMEPSV